MNISDFELSLFIGEKKKDYYLAKWTKAGTSNKGNFMSWNWASFFGSFLWLAYRKMYLYSFIIAFAFIFISLVFPSANTIFIVIPFLVGIFGNSLYYAFANKKIMKVKSSIGDNDAQQNMIKKKGGTGFGKALIIFVLYSIILVIIATSAGDEAITEAKIINNTDSQSKNSISEESKNNIISETTSEKQNDSSFQKVNEEKINEAEEYNKLGLEYIESYEFDKAIMQFDLALQIIENPDYLYNKALALMGIKEKYNEALGYIDKAIQLDAENTDYYTRKALILNLSGKYEEAIFQAEKALELDSKNAEAYFEKGNALYKLNESEKAIESFNKAVELDRDKYENIVKNLTSLAVSNSDLTPESNNTKLLNDSAQEFMKVLDIDFAEIPPYYGDESLYAAMTADYKFSIWIREDISAGEFIGCSLTVKLTKDKPIAEQYGDRLVYCNITYPAWEGVKDFLKKELLSFDDSFAKNNNKKQTYEFSDSQLTINLEGDEVTITIIRNGYPE